MLGKVALVAPIVGLVVIASACTTVRSLDRSGIESDIREQLLPQHPGVVNAVTCEDVREPMPGDRMTCSAVIGAQEVDVVVTIDAGPPTDLDTEQPLTATAEVQARLVSAAEIAQLLANEFSAELGLITGVSCGQPIVALEADEQVECVAEDPSGKQRTFAVTVDDAGEVSLRLL